MKFINIADTVVHRTALEQYLAESAADSLFAATTEIVQCSGAGQSRSQCVGLGLPAHEPSDVASKRPEHEPRNKAEAANRPRLSPPAARPERYDVAHDQLYDYVDQRARRLVRIDEKQFDGLASTSR